MQGLITKISTEDVFVVVQSRMGSNRLPGKALEKVGADSLIEWVLARLALSFETNRIILALPKTRENAALVSIGREFGVIVHCGEEDDVLQRFSDATQDLKPDSQIIRVCADNPFVSGKLLLKMKNFAGDKKNFVVHTLSKPPEFPYIDGLGAEIFSRLTLTKLNSEITSKMLREHVTLAVHLGMSEVKAIGMPAPKMYQSENLKLDLDTISDLEYLNNVVRKYNLTPLSDDLEIIRAFIDYA